LLFNLDTNSKLSINGEIDIFYSTNYISLGLPMKCCSWSNALDV